MESKSVKKRYDITHIQIEKHNLLLNTSNILFSIYLVFWMTFCPWVWSLLYSCYDFSYDMKSIDEYSSFHRLLYFCYIPYCDIFWHTVNYQSGAKKQSRANESIWNSTVTVEAELSLFLSALLPSFGRTASICFIEDLSRFAILCVREWGFYQFTSHLKVL